jgi:hypothetical protein
MRRTISRLCVGSTFLAAVAAGAAPSCSERLTAATDGPALVGAAATTGDAAATTGNTGGAGGRPDAGSDADAGRRIPVPRSDAGNPTTGCSLVGSWYLTSSHGSVYSHDVIAFEADGSYYGGANGADLVDDHDFAGQYAVNGSTFSLLSSSGDGTCTGPGTFDVQFQSNCAIAILRERTTACTGTRTAVAGEVILIEETVDAGTPPGTNRCPPIPPTDPGNPATGCSLVGLWSLSNSHGTVQSKGLVQFRADGSYYGGPTGVDLTQTYTYDGEYSVSGSTFNLVFSCGDGTCTGSGSFDMQFQGDCAAATLTERSTECTGNRTAVAGNVSLTRVN